jgi:hypothetical protein
VPRFSPFCFIALDALSVLHLIDLTVSRSEISIFGVIQR